MAVFIWLSSQPHNNNTPIVTRVLLQLMVMTSSNSGDELISTFQLSKWYSSDSTDQVISSIQLSKWYSLDSDYQAISIIQISIWSWNKICHMVSYYIFFKSYWRINLSGPWRSSFFTFTIFSLEPLRVTTNILTDLFILTRL